MAKRIENTQLLGQKMTFEGTLVFEGQMVINGYAKGTIESKEGTIIIGEDAIINANITVRNAIISGEVKGFVTAFESINLHSPAYVSGDLVAPIVSIDAGAMLNGKCATSGAIPPTSENNISGS